MLELGQDEAYSTISHLRRDTHQLIDLIEDEKVGYSKSVHSVSSSRHPLGPFRFHQLKVQRTKVPNRYVPMAAHLIEEPSTAHTLHTIAHRKQWEPDTENAMVFTPGGESQPLISNVDCSVQSIQKYRPPFLLHISSDIFMACEQSLNYNKDVKFVYRGFSKRMKQQPEKRKIVYYGIEAQAEDLTVDSQVLDTYRSAYFSEMYGDDFLQYITLLVMTKRNIMLHGIGTKEPVYDKIVKRIGRTYPVFIYYVKHGDGTTQLRDFVSYVANTILGSGKGSCYARLAQAAADHPDTTIVCVVHNIDALKDMTEVHRLVGAGVVIISNVTKLTPQPFLFDLGFTWIPCPTPCTNEDDVSPYVTREGLRVAARSAVTREQNVLGKLKLVLHQVPVIAQRIFIVILKCEFPWVGKTTPTVLRSKPVHADDINEQLLQTMYLQFRSNKVAKHVAQFVSQNVLSEENGLYSTQLKHISVIEQIYDEYSKV
ncbi:hypothetical protein PCE1_002419 [Barthelona sp. PCE]